MKKGWYGNIPLLGLILPLLACGCGYRAETEDGTDPYEGVTAMEETPVVEYAVPQMNANVLADREGYAVTEKKKAAVRGTKLPEEFRVIDADSGEVVYQGRISDVNQGADKNFETGWADFSGLTREGNFYLECDVIGRSYDFRLSSDYYRELFEENCRLAAEECEDGTLSAAAALDVLEAVEWYGEIFPDENADQEPDILESLKLWIAHREASGVEQKEEALYAAILAKFSYRYQAYDREYATDCLKRASTVFGQIQTAVCKDADVFLALTELYRATGRNTYKKQLQEYEDFFAQDGGFLDETGYLYGVMTYIATRQPVEMEMCQIFMEKLMDRAEEISNRCEGMIHPVTGRNNGPEELLKLSVEVSCVNYVMNIYQYTSISEEMLHYLMGQNPESVNFYEQTGERSQYLLLFAQLTANVPDVQQPVPVS